MRKRPKPLIHSMFTEITRSEMSVTFNQVRKIFPSFIPSATIVALVPVGIPNTIRFVLSTHHETVVVCFTTFGNKHSTIFGVPLNGPLGDNGKAIDCFLHDTTFRDK